MTGQWQGIESAPKDGTKVLLIDMEDTAILGPTYALAAWEYGKWRDMGDIGAAGCDPYTPTHWMPLPEPPSAIPSDV